VQLRLLHPALAIHLLYRCPGELQTVAEEQKETPDNEEAPAAEAKPKGGGLIGKLVLVGAIVITSSLCAGAVSWIVVQRAMASLQPATEEGPAAGGEAEEHAADDTGGDIAEAIHDWAALPLEPFVVNLADTDAARYLRIRVSLMIDDKSELAHLEENKALQVKLRDVILQTLTQKTSKDLIDEAGKNKLREDIRAKVSVFLKKPKIVDVMFTDFVIQL
jgi:flagellar FliL protein